MGPKLVLVVAAAAALGMPPTCGAQALGDASKKEKQRRESSHNAEAKTYTQEELATLPPVANEGAAPAGVDSTPAAPLAPTSSAPAPSADDEAATRARDEATWRSRVLEARAQVEKARKQHETLAGMNLVPGYQYVDDKGRPVIGSVEELQKLTAQAKSSVEASQKALDDLLEQARRANVPPGWLR
jgi:hypothetical protein